MVSWFEPDVTSTRQPLHVHVGKQEAQHESFCTAQRALYAYRDTHFVDSPSHVNSSARLEAHTPTRNAYLAGVVTGSGISGRTVSRDYHHHPVSIPTERMCPVTRGYRDHVGCLPDTLLYGQPYNPPRPSPTRHTNDSGLHPDLQLFILLPSFTTRRGEEL